ncbi:hypothetical protein EUX98_g84 [Antrodiella citrinella]|uniref:Protein CPL1-like domain-containing protein n=1 Tax=Antrodiella citrinella TaxID=2447956 RepID=A0A4S4N4P7_9APHY|nr:hypothetical protein EUX98_g84 [Antrodiella citrinella]
MWSQLLLVAAALPFVLATGSSSCGNGNFYFQQADCCVPQGGNPSPPTPPSGTQCPTSGWDWNDDKSCCVPHQPPAPSQPPPACNSGWGWQSDKLHCTPAPSTPTPPPSKPPTSTPPTSSPGNCNDNEFWWETKSCCLPNGGPSTPPPAPPSGTSCPSSGWSWFPTKSCCAPHQTSPPTPQCPSGWTWNSGAYTCQPNAPSSPPSAPSAPSSPGNCDENNFWWEPKQCCLPNGGPSTPPPSPPSGSNCPPSGWSWLPSKSCCSPHTPPSNGPPPQCPSGWSWNPSDYQCHPSAPTSPAPPPSKPSGYAGHQRRSGLKARAAPLCPNGHEACPIQGASGLTGDYECLDTTQELTSCGGCASLGAGQDCTAIAGAWNVKCDVSQGGCKVLTCTAGYKVGVDGKSCIQL